MQHLGLTSNARAASPMETLVPSRRAARSLNSFVNCLRDNPMTQFYVPWILSINHCLKIGASPLVARVQSQPVPKSAVSHKHTHQVKKTGSLVFRNFAIRVLVGRPTPTESARSLPSARS